MLRLTSMLAACAKPGADKLSQVGVHLANRSATSMGKGDKFHSLDMTYEGYPCIVHATRLGRMSANLSGTPNPNLDRPRSQFAMLPSRALASRFLLAERHAQRVVAASSQWLRAAIRLAHAPPLAGDLLQALDAALSLAGNLRERCSSRTSRKSPHPRARAKSVWLARICRRCVAFEGWLARRADRALSACRRQLLVPRRELATSVTQLLRFGIRHAYADQHGTSQTRTG